MRLHTRCDMTLEASEDCPAVGMLRPSSGLAQWLVSEHYDFKPRLRITEYVDAYEVGIKTKLFANRFAASLSGFHYDYQNIQVLVNAVTANTTVSAGNTVPSASCTPPSDARRAVTVASVRSVTAFASYHSPGCRAISLRSVVPAR